MTDRDFDHVVEQARLPVLVEFWKPGCGRCRALIRELERLELDVDGEVLILKMNVEENFQIPRNWRFAHYRCWPSIAEESSSGLSAGWGERGDSQQLRLT